MQRRDFIRNASLALAAFGLPSLPACAASKSGQMGLRRLGQPQPFDFATLKGQARALAQAPYKSHKRVLPGRLEGLDWDQYQSIGYRQDHALWADQPGKFQAKFFHLGLYFHSPVRMFDVVDGKAQELAYDGAAFNYGKSGIKDGELPADLGFAGFRLNTRKDTDRDFAAFLGASYFRAVGKEGQYGQSARGLAIDTGMGKPEEFPDFIAYYLEQPSAIRLRPAGFAQRGWRLPLRDHQWRRAADGHRQRAVPAQGDRAAGHRTVHQHVPGGRERPPHGMGLAPGDPRYRWPVAVDRCRRMDLAAAAEPAQPALQHVRGPQPARLRPAAARPQLRPLPGRRRVLREAPVPVGGAEGRMGRGLGAAGGDSHRGRDLRQHRGVLEPEGKAAAGPGAAGRLPPVLGRRTAGAPPLAHCVASRTGLGGVVGKKREYFSWRFAVDFEGASWPA
jgi:hypothetical protein